MISPLRCMYDSQRENYLVCLSHCRLATIPMSSDLAEAAQRAVDYGYALLDAKKEIKRLESMQYMDKMFKTMYESGFID